MQVFAKQLITNYSLPMIRYFDAHTHVQFAAYDTDRKETIERALKAGVSFINVGTQADTSAFAVKLAHGFSTFSNSPEQNKFATGQARELEKVDFTSLPQKNLAKEIKVARANVYASVGLHPIHTEKSFHDEQELGLSGDKGFTSRAEDFDYDYYKKLALDPKVVAIGECGLDYFRIKNYELGFKNDELQIKKKQKEAFTKQIELAIEINKPLMIHCRDAFDDLIKILKSYFLNHKSSRSPGVVHFYSGTVEDTKKLMELGFSFTFGGVVTFPPKAGQPRADTPNYDEIIKMIPLDRILSETDAPYVAPAPYRGKRNEPAYVVEIVKKLAEIKDISIEQMQQHIWENAKRIFTL